MKIEATVQHPATMSRAMALIVEPTGVQTPSTPNGDDDDQKEILEVWGATSKSMSRVRPRIVTRVLRSTTPEHAVQYRSFPGRDRSPFRGSPMA